MTSPQHAAPIADRWQRLGRTAIQIGAAVVTLAPAYPAIRAAVEEPLANAAAVGWIGTGALIVSGLMSIPRVNALLSRLKLAAPTVADVPASDSPTQAIWLADLQAR